jgi:hypothetical protein
MLLVLALSPALADSPKSIAITYTARFEMDDTGDRLCGMTGLCDCQTVYTGTGTLHEQGESRLTFTGTWKTTSNTCGDQLTVWVPPDGKAFHTLRWSDGTLQEWVVHRDAAQHQRLTQGMKASGQYWINELAQPWKDGPQSVSIHQEDGQTLVMGVRLDGFHDLAIETK